MNSNMRHVVKALQNTGTFLLLGLALCIVMGMAIGPLVIIASLEGPTWAVIVSMAWAVIFFVFTIALLHEFEG